MLFFHIHARPCLNTVCLHMLRFTFMNTAHTYPVIENIQTNITKQNVLKQTQTKNPFFSNPQPQTPNQKHPATHISNPEIPILKSTNIPKFSSPPNPNKPTKMQSSLKSGAFSQKQSKEVKTRKKQRQRQRETRWIGNTSSG